MNPLLVHFGGRRRASLPGLLLNRARRWSALARTRSARQLAAVAGSGLAAGIVLEFFLDPRSGRRRRHLIRDRTKGILRRRRRVIERHAHYEAGKVVGLAHAITHHDHGAELDDVGLVRKVESELFRDRTIPKGQISINADRGIVVLRGQLDNPKQIERIEHSVRKIVGVREVENLLHPSSTPAPASHPHGQLHTGPAHE
jgi:hyperosmotically inducible periplasmic protein